MNTRKLEAVEKILRIENISYTKISQDCLTFKYGDSYYLWSTRKTYFDRNIYKSDYREVE